MAYRDGTVGERTGYGWGQTALDFARGIGDTITLGITEKVRNWYWGPLGEVQSKAGYFAGSVTGTLMQIYMTGKLPDLSRLYSVADYAQSVYSTTQAILDGDQWGVASGLFGIYGGARSIENSFAQVAESTKVVNQSLAVSKGGVTQFSEAEIKANISVSRNVQIITFTEAPDAAGLLRTGGYRPSGHELFPSNIPFLKSPVIVGREIHLNTYQEGLEGLKAVVKHETNHRQFFNNAELSYIAFRESTLANATGARGLVQLAAEVRAYSADGSRGIGLAIDVYRSLSRSGNATNALWGAGLLAGSAYVAYRENK